MKYIVVGLVMIFSMINQAYAGGSQSSYDVDTLEDVFADAYVVETPGFEIVKAAMKGDIGQVRGLIAKDVHGIYAHHRDTALLEASRRGYPEIVKMLIEANANVNYREGMDNTPLMAAAQNGHIEVIKALLQAPDIDVFADREGNTALSLAWGYQRFEKPEAEKLIRDFINQKKKITEAEPTTEVP